ncbi:MULTISPECIES: SDR family oxidoreductase [Pseudomonas]|jgi:short-subunit dehydrogenase|uniref:Oxidoreductase, short-chain dehydrogenase/reductase family n=2 Tax=Pseudomonas putida group TaxID=136845 RepID=Q88JD8_PSEPK|nr:MULTISPECIES: SDR family oxidoreductase [Pseudomonas]AAN68319.1 Oxidoreductase, short-chain dehydrogenase/reductase family [Pseudomonas putida KT2440]KMU97993.1 short-chain dehydrogenase [Pseudomonas putida]KMY34989.1 short-chain dehydrogenase [Pseudomonas putida]MBP2838885.1 SDR family oxidoreductase [Pseudomonas sp. PNP]MCE0860272.1 SDR family oxidoreductase [Pseudomonas alloputida]
MRLAESVVILTGASGGIGLELAEQLCAAGAQVLAVSRHMGKLAGLMNRYPDRLRWQEADLRSPSGREQVIERAREMGAVNVLINAAGVNRFALLDQLDEYALDELLDINLKAPLQLTRACLPLLRAQPKALVVNVGSTYGSIGYPGYATYCASKFALRGFSQALRRELADTTVNVLYAAPRATRTTMNSSAATALNQALKVGMDDPADVARAVLQAVQSERTELYLGWPEKLFVRINGMLPGMVDRALRKQLPVIRRYIGSHSKESNK